MSLTFFARLVSCLLSSFSCHSLSAINERGDYAPFVFSSNPKRAIHKILPQVPPLTVPPHEYYFHLSVLGERRLRAPDTKNTPDEMTRSVFIISGFSGEIDLFIIFFSYLCQWREQQYVHVQFSIILTLGPGSQKKTINRCTVLTVDKFNVPTEEETTGWTGCC